MLISLPIDNIDKVYFNAHRAFSRDTVMKMFKGLRLLEEKYIYGYKTFDNYIPEKGFGTGLYLLTKEESNVL